MGRESNDPIIAQSSIALLQERFRQVERAREMRAERELSKLFLSEPKIKFNYSTLPYEPEPTRLFFHPDQLILQPLMSPPPVQQPSSLTTLSLWPSLQSKHGDLGLVEAPLLTSLCQRETPSAKSMMMNRFDEDPVTDDVDTSLHL